MTPDESNVIVVKINEELELPITRANWLSKDNKIIIKELLEKIEPDIKEENKGTLEEIRKIIYTEKERNKPRTYFFKGIVIEKSKRRINKKEKEYDGKVYVVKSYGEVFYTFKVNITSEGVPTFEKFYSFKNVLDNPEDWDLVESASTGETWEFEVEKPKTTNWTIRGLRKF